MYFNLSCVTLKHKHTQKKEEEKKNKDVCD